MHYWGSGRCKVRAAPHPAASVQPAALRRAKGQAAALFGARRPGMRGESLLENHVRL